MALRRLRCMWQRGGDPLGPAVFLAALMLFVACSATKAQTIVSIVDGQWMINGEPTNPGSAAEGLLMNVRMVNATFEDRSGKHPDFDPEANADEFIAAIPDYVAHGVNAFTLCLQGGMPGYEGAVNSAFESDGSLRSAPLQRMKRVIRACDRHAAAVILTCYYQRQSHILQDEQALRRGLVHVVDWIRNHEFQHVVLEVANEYPHGGFAHRVIRDPDGQAALIRFVKQTAPELLVTASGLGNGRVHTQVGQACDFVAPHWNGTPVETIPQRLADLAGFQKPIVCNEDDKTGAQAVAAMRATVANRAGYGLMLKAQNQTYPFRFKGAADDPVYYAALKQITSRPVEQRSR